MKNIIITADRMRESVAGYTVLVRTNGIGSVDVSIWLNDAEARDLAAQLLRAATPATMSEAAA